MSKDRMDRFIWNEGELELYDKDGNRLVPKTMKPIENDSNPPAAEIKKSLNER